MERMSGPVMKRMKEKETGRAAVAGNNFRKETRAMMMTMMDYLSQCIWMI